MLKEFTAVKRQKTRPYTNLVACTGKLMRIRRSLKYAKSKKNVVKKKRLIFIDNNLQQSFILTFIL